MSTRLVEILCLTGLLTAGTAACAGDPKTPPAPTVSAAAEGLPRDRGCGPRPLPDAVEMPSFDEAFAQADLVFAGRHRNADDPIPLTQRVAPEDLILDHRFEVYRIWKGDPADTLIVRSYRAPSSGGVDFSRGNVYLVYAVRDSGHFWVNRCTRTARLTAAYADLYKLGEPRYDTGGGSIPALDRATLAHDLRSPEQARRMQALRILEQIAPDEPEALPVILEAYALQRGAARLDFVASLGRIGPAGAAAAPALLATLEDPDPTLRGMAVSSLGKIGLVTPDVLPALLGALDDADPTVRAVAAQSLGGLGSAAPPEVAPALRRALDDPEPRVRDIASRALQLLGASSP